jgi:hypothetical protein
MLSWGRKELDLEGKCETCKHYCPLKKEWKGYYMEFARGNCQLKNQYKQRTETCKRWE